MKAKHPAEVSAADAAAALDAARQKLAEIEAKRSVLSLRKEAIVQESRDLAYHSLGGDAAAQKRSYELRQELQNVVADLEDIDAATETAQHLVDKAQVAVLREAELARAKKIRAHAAALRAHGNRLDECAAKLAKAFAAIGEEIAAIHRLGIAHPNGDLIRVNLTRGLNTALRDLPLRLDVVRPGDRYSFDEIVDAIAKSIERQADEIDGPAAAAAA